MRRAFPIIPLSIALVVALPLAGCAHRPPSTAAAPPAPRAPAPVPPPSQPAAAPVPAPPAAAPAAPAATGSTGGAAPESAKPRPAAPPPLTVQVTRSTLENYPGWEQLRAQEYTPDPPALAALKDQMKDVDALLFVASWCPDSKRDVPRLFKIMDAIGYPQARVTMHALDRTKKDAAGLTMKWKVERVPTFIFVRGEHEVGRYVERPATTLENDLVQALKK